MGTPTGCLTFNHPQKVLYTPSDILQVPYGVSCLKDKMTHTIADKQKLLNRVRKLRGQVDALERALDSEAGCAEVMHLLTASRGAIPGRRRTKMNSCGLRPAAGYANPRTQPESDAKKKPGRWARLECRSHLLHVVARRTVSKRN